MFCAVTDCSPLQFLEPCGEAYSRLSSDRRRKADRYVFTKDRILSIAAGLYMRLIEGSYGGITIDANGKPQAEGIHFNISHSGKYVAFACSDSSVGIDIETVGRNMDIAERVTTPDEYLCLSRIRDDGDRDDMFCRMWTAKESYMKALGLGFRLPPESFRVLYDDGISRNAPDGKLIISELPPPEGYHVSVCSSDGASELKILDVMDLIDAVDLDSILG